MTAQTGNTFYQEKNVPMKTDYSKDTLSAVGCFKCGLFLQCVTNQWTGKGTICFCILGELSLYNTYECTYVLCRMKSSISVLHKPQIVFSIWAWICATFQLGLLMLCPMMRHNDLITHDTLMHMYRSNARKVSPKNHWQKIGYKKTVMTWYRHI